MPDGLHNIPAATLLEIEDAVLFGNAHELDDLLEMIDGDEAFSDELRHGIEALRYVRGYQGKKGEKHNLNKKKIALMESSWGAGVLELLRRSEAKVLRIA